MCFKMALPLFRLRGVQRIWQAQFLNLGRRRHEFRSRVRISRLSGSSAPLGAGNRPILGDNLQQFPAGVSFAAIKPVNPSSRLPQLLLQGTPPGSFVDVE
jgi:hypothetical protein